MRGVHGGASRAPEASPNQGGRVRIRHETVDRNDSQAADRRAGLKVKARALAYLFGAGATLLAVSIALPHPSIYDDRGLVVVAAVAYGTTALLLVQPGRWAPWSFHVILALGTALITAGVHFSAGLPGYSFFYVWVGLYAFYFFTHRQAVLHLLLVGVAYAAVLVGGADAGAPLAQWLITLGTVTVAGTFVARLVAEIRARAAEASARAERLRAVERRTRSIVDTAGEAFLAINPAGTILDVNPQAAALTGWSRTELVGEQVGRRLIAPARWKHFEREVAQLELGDGHDENHCLEFVVLHRDGHEIPVEASISALADDEGVVFNAFVRDVGDRKRAERDMRDQIEDLEVVAGVARDLAGVANAHDARRGICEAAAQLAGGSTGILYELDRQGAALVSTATSASPQRRIHVPLAGASGAGTAFKSGRPLFVGDPVDNPAVRQQVVRELGVKSALWQPILRDGVPIGVLAVAWKEPVESVTERVSSLIALLAAEAAAAIERADLLGRLESVARTDDLTGLANRRAWEELLPRELARAAREQEPLCVAMLDLDHFKDFNDDYGHQAGDRLLKEVTAAWREILRPSDVLARYGGEEFVLLIPTCDLESGLEVVERLREMGAEGPTCSAGLAVWNGEESPDALISRADRALYEAKRAGRDRALAA